MAKMTTAEEWVQRLVWVQFPEVSLAQEVEWKGPPDPERGWDYAYDIAPPFKPGAEVWVVGGVVVARIFNFRGRKELRLQHSIACIPPLFLTWLKQVFSKLPGVEGRILRKLLRGEVLGWGIGDWSTSIAPAIAQWATGRLGNLSKNHDYVDNQRVACIRNSPQKRRYRRQKDRGCCGSVDVVEKCPIDGKTYRLGFNYGH